MAILLNLVKLTLGSKTTASTIMENAQIEQFEVTPADTASTRWERWVRRFDNFVVAKGITNDTRIKAMMLHHAGETVFELSESVGVLDTDTCAVTREKLTAYFGNLYLSWPKLLNTF